MSYSSHTETYFDRLPSCISVLGKDEPGQHTHNPDRDFRGGFGQAAAPSEKDALHRGMQPLTGHTYLFLLTSWQGPGHFPAVGSEAFPAAQPAFSYREKP